MIADPAELDLAAAASPELHGSIELDDPLCVISTSGIERRAEAGRADLRQPPLERRRLRHADRPARRRPLALLPAAASRRRAVDRDPQRRSTARPRSSSASTRSATAATIGAGGVTIVSLVATMLERLLDAGVEPADLRCALLGGGPAPQALIERALDAGVPVAPTYGLTEACSQVTTLAARAGAREARLGRPAAARRPGCGSERTVASSSHGPTVAPRRGRQRRLAAHRRPRPDRLGRPPLRARPRRRGDRHRRRERLARGGRERAARASGDRRRGRVRTRGRAVAARRRGRDRRARRRSRPTTTSCAPSAASGCPASRCRRASSRSNSCRATRRASCSARGASRRPATALSCPAGAHGSSLPRSRCSTPSMKCSAPTIR